MVDQSALHKFYEAIKIPIQLYSDNDLVGDYGSDTFIPNPAIHILGNATDDSIPVCYSITPEFLICGFVRIRDSSEILVVGPVKTFECTRKQAQNILMSLNQTFNRTDELLSWLRGVPFCDNQRFRKILCFLDHIINNAGDRDAIFITHQASNPSIPANNNPLMTFSEHFSDSFEKQMLTHIEYGNTEALMNDLEKASIAGGSIPPLSSDAVRSFRNVFIVSTTLASRAAVKGGLDYDTANALTDMYISQIEKLNNYSDISVYLRKMFIDFVQRTAKSRVLRSDSPLINKINKDIRAHLYEKATPTIISERLKINCAYLCRHFKKETGKTIAEYINELKVEECKQLLITTQIPLIQISAQLGFSSQNYFQTIFKKFTGITPAEFRNKA